MGIKNLIKRAGGKAADTINRLSVLSPEQVKHVEELREMYLSEIPDPSDVVAEELTEKLLAVCGVEIYNAYLPQLNELYVPIEREAEYDGQKLDVSHNLRYCNITKWVTDKKENNIEKLINVYQVLSNEECNIALIFNRTCHETNVYLAVLNTANDNNNVKANNFRDRLVDAIKGNCPGAEISNGSESAPPCFDDNKQYSVATATNIPTEKSEKFISQTIEKLLDGTIPSDNSEEYTLVLLATPILDVEERKLHLTDIYTALAPYASWQTNFQYTESDSTGSMALFGVNAGINAGVQSGNNRSTGRTDGTTDTEGDTNSRSETKGKSESETNSHSDSKGTNWGGNAGLNVGVGGENGIPEIGGSIGGCAGKFKSVTDTVSKGITTTKSTTDTISKITSKAKSVANTVSKGVSRATNFGANFGANFARSSNVTATIGKNEGITQTFTNYNIKHSLDMLEEQMKRYEKSSALGMWDFAAYVIGEDQNIVNNVAHSYIGLTQGEASYMSRSSINLWRGDLGEDSRDAHEIYSYIKELRHPLFGINPELTELDPDLFVYPPIVSATTALSGKELSFSLNFPQKSVAGLPVLECAEFGRTVVTYDGNDGRNNTINLGRIFHMNHEERTKIKLSSKSLTSHAFITGSTGAGKSNAVYQILDEVLNEGIKFLVIEPTKGEYKNVFGSREDVNVYGTNPRLNELLRINPFSFPSEIHVLEHIDRIVEIFNVCWPMYAAMPAVLKDAIEKSYEDCGWNLTESTNRYDDSYYPRFADIERNVKQIIDASEYDAENKGAYKGSLLTRLHSLTNGLNGMIFCDDEIGSDMLFESNAIVDLSRVGSSETKSLIMGILVLKLQEYRISSAEGMNSNLKHVTVLEEAHHILKRTSTEQNQEGANLLGKSVEMIANAIAEMRTYGEGFIIADQSPGLLDMAAIRNTNTKIIMRLPDKGDRELVGYAANLDDDQIKELAKLPCGVAAVYQNEWVQPVLCKVKLYDAESVDYSYMPEHNDVGTESLEDKKFIAEVLSSGREVPADELQNDIKPRLNKIGLDASIKVKALDMMVNPAEQPRMTKMAIIYDALFPTITEAVKAAYQETSEASVWTKYAEDAVHELGIDDMTTRLRLDIIQCGVTYYLINVADKIADLEKWSEMGGLK
ncbi:ATP-binding protein [Mogibacterium diversum]|uniref:ATP-binding protein n=1 Tax=Mogibacterium diversum TaxID=114527 RepID=UPI0028E7E6E8|nr:ATP-binding protein [Mogibacterium diversum]